VHTVLQVKENTEDSQTPVIICTNQILSSTEAEVMKSNSWLYHYYMVQSRLQYGLAYGAHTPGLAAYYPQMLGGGAQPQPFYDTSPHSLSQAYLGHSNASGFSGAAASSLYPGYLYNHHSAPTYHLPAEHSIHNLTSNTKDLFPLDFSKDYSRDFRGGLETRDFRGGVESRDYRGGGAEYTPQQSSPSLGSDTSSSPVYQPPHESLYGAEVALLSQARYSHSEHHFKGLEERGVEAEPAPTARRENSMLLWSQTEVSGFERYKNLDCDAIERSVKKEAETSDTNNNSNDYNTYHNLSNSLR